MPKADDTRTVLRVKSMDDGGQHSVTIDIDETPVKGIPPDRSKMIPLRGDETAYQDLRRCPHPNLVKIAGELLYGSLTSDSKTRRVLHELLNAPAGSAVSYPIYFRMDSPAMESLPWEALYEARHSFLTITDRWPIGRMPVSMKRDDEATRTIWPKLRIAAVIAAAGKTTDGAGQWDALLKALQNSPIDPVEVLVLTSDRAVVNEVRKKAVAGVSVDYVGDDADDLLRRISAFSPNLVHFYCHGTADGRPELEVEKLEDRVLGRSQGTIRLDEMTLLPLCVSNSIWAVTLNCCEGARGSASSCSLAHSLSAQGVPVVVAMRESIHFADAHLFAAAFYSALASELEPLFALHRFGKPFQVEDLLWGRALRSARVSLRDPAINRLVDERLKELCLQDPEASAREWTYPVLYLHRGGLRLKPCVEAPALTMEESARLQAILHGYKKQREQWIREEETRGVIAKLDDEIRKIEEQLYPPFATPDPSEP